MTEVGSMRAVVYERYGSPEELRVSDLERPRAGPGEVLVEVRATSINSWDWELLVGTFQGRMGFLAPGRPRHPVLGADVAGTAEEVGRDVTGFEVGDEVYGDLSGVGWGGLAEYVATSASAPTTSSTTACPTRPIPPPVTGVTT